MKITMSYVINRLDRRLERKGENMSELEKTLNWFELAVPNPTDKNKSVQLGCYL
jgi:hypothetical protein